MTSLTSPPEAPGHHRVLEIYRRAGDQLGVATVLERMAYEARSAAELFALTEQSRRIHREQADLRGLAMTLGRHAHDLALVRGDYRRALDVNEKSLHLHWTLSSRAQSVASIRSAAHVQLQLGETGKAFDLLDDAIRVSRSLLPHAPLGCASLLELQGALQHDVGDLEGALASLREAERLVAGNGETRGLSATDPGASLGLRLAWLLLELDSAEEARAYALGLADRPLALRYDVRARQLEACSVLAAIATTGGAYRTAARWLRRGLEPAARFPLVPVLQRLLVGAGGLLLALGEDERAAALLAGVAAHPGSSGICKQQAVSLSDRCISPGGVKRRGTSAAATASTGGLLAWLAVVEADLGRGG